MFAIGISFHEPDIFHNSLNNLNPPQVGSPCTNNYYLHQTRGEVYGLDHNRERFSAWNVARLRPKTDVEGLFLTGQDVLTCGVCGAMMAGLVTSGAVLGRNVYFDLIKLLKSTKKAKKTD